MPLDTKIYLAEWRQYAKLTQRQLGEILKVTAAQISRVETGKRDFDGRYLLKFSQAINSTLDEQKQSMERSGSLRIIHYCHPLTVAPDPATMLHDNPAVKEAISLIAREAIERHERIKAEDGAQPET